MTYALSRSPVRQPEAGPGSGGLLDDRARVFLISDHEDDDLRAFVRARVSGDGVDCGRRLVERLACVQDPAGLAVDGELVGALDHVAERVMARMPVRRAAAPRRAIEQRDADLAAREIGERLDEERLGGGRRGWADDVATNLVAVHFPLIEIALIAQRLAASIRRGISAR